MHAIYITVYRLLRIRKRLYQNLFVRRGERGVAPPLVGGPCFFDLPEHNRIDKRLRSISIQDLLVLFIALLEFRSE